MDQRTSERMAAAVARAARAESERCRRASATIVLSILSAAACAPLLATGTALPVAAALAGVAGNVGGGVLSAVIDRAIARLQDGSDKQTQPDDLREKLAIELLAALEKDDEAARELQTGLFNILVQIDGIQAAVNAVGDETREHLLACFSALAGQQAKAQGNLDAIVAGLRRQERRQWDQTALLEEIADRQRLLMRKLHPPATTAPGIPALRSGPSTAEPLIVPTEPTAAKHQDWTGGAEVTVADRVYLLHTDFTAERLSTDGSLLFRQARALRLVPAGRRGHENAWLRQIVVRHGRPGASSALSALEAERDMLARFDPARGLPRVTQMAADGRTATLVLTWPASRSTGGPCDTLQAELEARAAQLDSWRMFRLISGLAGLCDCLGSLHESGVTHRDLTPAGIIAFDSGQLVLRDLGLAAHEYQPGESSAEYLAPEQRLGSRDRPGPPTDVYQLAAVAYHLLTGVPPHPRLPLPLNAQVPGVPGRLGAVLDVALAADSDTRPGIRSLGRALFAACDDLV